jgi:ribosomal protein L10
VAKTFYLKGGEYPLAISKQRKEEVLAQYNDWIKRSEAVILVEYTGANMKSLDGLRAKIREAGGEFHVVKNTLVRRVFADNGMDMPGDMLGQVHGCLVRVYRPRIHCESADRCHKRQ